jgi:hypothetical protein
MPRLSVAYEHDFNANTNENHRFTCSVENGPALGSLVVLGPNRGANNLNVTLNVELGTSDQLSIYASMGGSLWSNGNELNYCGGLRCRFGGAPRSTIAKPPVNTPPKEQLTPATPPQTIHGTW